MSSNVIHLHCGRPLDEQSGLWCPEPLRHEPDAADYDTLMQEAEAHDREHEMLRAIHAALEKQNGEAR